MFNKIKEIIFHGGAENVRRTADIEYTRDCVRRKFPLLGTTMAELKTVATRRIGGAVLDTAATDGKTVYYNPDFFDKLSDDERAFIYAHEVCHVAFNHILRSKGRNQRLWNIATDAVINQMLKSENLPMVSGGVDIADAINHSAEEMYEKLLEQEKNKKSNQNQQNGDGDKSQSQSGDGGKGADKENEQAGHDNHQIWKDAVAQHDKNAQKQNKQQNSQQQPRQRQQQNQSADEQKSNQKSSNQKSDAQNNKSEKMDGNGEFASDDAPGNEKRDFNNWKPENESQYERGFVAENQKARSEIAAAAREQLKIAKNRAMETQINESINSFGDVGRAPAVVDWKRMLNKTLASEQERWSYRRSNADNGYMARVEEMEDDDKSETEVLLDVSGSVSDGFLREFLRQLRPLLKNSRLRVGCFSHCFYPFVEIKNDRDINNFRIPPRGNTDWNLAVKSFTPKRHINKIVFTDGEMPGIMPNDSTRNINVIWLVYGNEPFNPVCGRVIRVRPREITQSYIIIPNRQR